MKIKIKQILLILNLQKIKKMEIKRMMKKKIK